MCLRHTPIVVFAGESIRLLHNILWTMTSNRYLQQKAPEGISGVGRQAFAAPNQGVESHFCCQIAGQRPAQKENMFRRDPHRMRRLRCDGVRLFHPSVCPSPVHSALRRGGRPMPWRSRGGAAAARRPRAGSSRAGGGAPAKRRLRKRLGEGWGPGDREPRSSLARSKWHVE